MDNSTQKMTGPCRNDNQKIEEEEQKRRNQKGGNTTRGLHSKRSREEENGTIQEQMSGAQKKPTGDGNGNTIRIGTTNQKKRERNGCGKIR